MSTYDQIIEKGFQIGLAKAHLIQENKINRRYVTSLICYTDFDDTKIAMLVGVTIDYVKDLRLELKK